MKPEATIRAADRRALFLLLAASTGCAMSLIDTNVVAVAVPAIARDLGAGAGDAQWIISAFFLTFSASLLPVGAIADRQGRRRTFLSGLAALAVASLVCGLAPTMLWLQFGRGIQGVATAFVLAPALAVIGHRFHGEAERNRAWAIWGGVMGVTMVSAPVVGGLVVESLGWRWGFFLNIPICIVLAGAVIAYADESRDNSRGRIDPPGILLFATSMFGLTWGLISVQAQGLGSAGTLAGFAVGVVAMCGFIVVERIQDHAMLDLGLFRNARFIGAVWAMFAYAATAQVMASLLPIFLQNGGGLSAATTGFAMLPFALAMLIFPYVGARLGPHLSSPAILALGLATVAVGNTAAGWGAWSGVWPLLLSGMFVIGSGAGLLNGETQKAIMMTIPRDQAGVASGVSTTARFSGILIGFAALNAVFAFGIRIRFASDACTSVTCPDQGELAEAFIAGDPYAALADRSESVISSVQQYYAMAFSTSFLAAALVAASSAALVWWLLRRPPPERR